MKKIFAILIITSLAACGGSTNPTDNKAADSAAVSKEIDSATEKMNGTPDSTQTKMEKMVDSAKTDVKMMGDSIKK